MLLAAGTPWLEDDKGYCFGGVFQPICVKRWPAYRLRGNSLHHYEHQHNDNDNIEIPYTLRAHIHTHSCAGVYREREREILILYDPQKAAGRG